MPRLHHARASLTLTVTGLVDNLMHWKLNMRDARVTLCGAAVRSNVSHEDWRHYTGGSEVPTCLSCIAHASR